MKKRFLAIFIVVLMLFSQITVFASGPDPSTTSINPEDKLTDELKEVMSNTPDGEYIPIYIWLNDDYSDELVYAHLSNKLGEEINVLNESAYISKRIEEKVEQYKTKQFSTQQRAATLSMQSAFENLSVESKISSLRNNADLSSIVTNKEIENCLNDGKSFEDIIELSERYQYLSDYRDSRATVNEVINEQFIQKLNTDKYRNLLLTPLVPYVEIECEKEYILSLAKLTNVETIGFIHEAYGESFIEDDYITNSTSENTDKYIVAPVDTIYTGSGIKVGVLDGTNYDENADHLVGKTIVAYSNSGTAGDNSHATQVMSILAGEKITLGTTEYQGVAPNVSLYFGRDTGSGPEIFLTILEWLVIQQDVAVINISMRADDNVKSYNVCERIVDCLVQQYRVVIVKSAGNNYGSVTSPGMAYNIITVGNLSNTVDTQGKYLIRSSSSYEEEDYLTNKPDIVAFGTDVHMVYNDEEVNFTSGTSYATPQVAGAVALMMQANPSLIGKPDAVKAILVNSADGDAVSANNNGIVSDYALNANYSNYNLWSFSSQIRERTGAGLLNVENAITTANGQIYRKAIHKSSTGGFGYSVGEFYFEEGQQIEFTLVFEKPLDNIIDSLSDVNFDFEISLYKGSQKIMNSISNVNNVESFRTLIAEDGYYTFVIYCDQYNGSVVEEDWETIQGYQPAEHTSHDYFYVTMLFSCGCSLSDLSKTTCTTTGHDIVCDNCTFSCFEPHEIVSLTKNYSSAAVTYTIGYKFKPSIEGIGSMRRECVTPLSVTVTPTNSNYNGVAIIETGNSEMQPDGSTIETRTYWVMIRNSSGALVTSFYSTITYSYDIYLGEYYMY